MLATIEANPQPFWEYLQSCNIEHRRKALTAWHSAMEQAACGLGNPINERIECLLHYEGLRDLMQQECRKSLKVISKLHPPQNVWTSAVFLPIELQFNSVPRAELQKDPSLQILRELKGANKQSLSAASILIARFKKMEIIPGQWSPDNWPQLQTEVRRLLNLVCDLQLIDELIDHLLYTDATIHHDRENDHISLFATETERDATQRNANKGLFQSIFNKRAAQYAVSETDFFKRVDPEYRTHEGFVTFTSSPGTNPISHDPGHVAIELPEDCWYFGDNHDSPEAKLARENNELATLKAHRAFYLRQLLASNLFVREKENFRATILFQDRDQRLTFLDFFATIASISAFFRSLNTHLAMSSWRGLLNRIKINIPELIAKGEIQEPLSWPDMVRWMLDQSPETAPEDWNLGPYLEWSPLEIARLAQEVDDLSHLQPSLIVKCFDLLADGPAQFPIPLMIRNGDSFILAWDAWSHPELMQWLFEDFYTAYVYDSSAKKTAADKTKATEIAKVRENQINHDVARSLQSLTHFTAAGVNFHHMDHAGKHLQGELDALAWFPAESTLLVIQMKLSNTTKTSHQKRKNWIYSKLKAEAASQVLKDRKWLQSPASRPWLRELFAQETGGLENSAKIPLDGHIKIQHLILTDNYYHDHQTVDPGDGNPVTVISLFELGMLLRNEDIFAPLSHDWFRERLIRIAQCYPTAVAPYPHTDGHAMSMAANQPDSAERAALQAFIEAHPTADFSKISTLRGLMDAIEGDRFWSLIGPFFGAAKPQVRELVCLALPHWRELVG